MKISMVNRLLFLLTGLLAAYQIAFGIEGLSTVPLVSYTVGFGVLLVAGTLLLILGYEALEYQPVVVVATLIPLSLSLGLVWEYLPAWRAAYGMFAASGLAAVILSRLRNPGRISTIILALVHAAAGLTIFILPIQLSLTGQTQPGFTLVGVGGGLIGLAGMALAFEKTGKRVISGEIILRILPGLLLAVTAAFVAGFAFA